MTPAHVRCPLYAALRDGRVTVDQQETLAINWLRSQPGPQLVLVSTIGEYGDSMLAEKFPRTMVEKLGGHTGAAHSGPLLVAWPDPADLAKLQDLAHVTAICVVEGGEVLQQPWLRAQRAIDLATGERLETKVGLVAPVVAIAIEGLVPMLNGLSSSRDTPTVIDAFCQLKARGHKLDPLAVYEFALRCGADGDEALLMHEVAIKLRAGHNYRRRGRVEADMVRHWEQQAAGLSA